MAVAFVALLIALGGTAYALPGSNSVTSGDIRNGAVKTQDIRNSTVRGGDVRNSTLTGGDVRNNTLTGNDVNEGSLGQVPSANRANFANSAGGAFVAGLAANVSRQTISQLVGANDDEEVILFTQAGFRLSLFCDEDAADTVSGSDAEIQIENVSAGNNAKFQSDYNNNNDLDEGETDYIVNDNGDPDQEVTFYAAIGPAGTFLSGNTIVGYDSAPSNFPQGVCQGAATGQG